MDTTKENYNIDLSVRYGNQQRIDVSEIAKNTTLKWSNQTLTQVNNSVVRLGVVEGEFHWHKHDNDDEFFFVTEGQLLIDLEGKTIELNPGQGVTISKGVMHRPRAPKRTVMLMVETSAMSMVFHSQCGNAVVRSNPLKCSRVGASVQNGVAFAWRQVR